MNPKSGDSFLSVEGLPSARGRRPTAVLHLRTIMHRPRSYKGAYFLNETLTQTPMMNLRRIVGLLPALLLPAALLHAQDKYKQFSPINTAIPSLSIAPDARGGGMGDIGAATLPGTVFAIAAAWLIRRQEVR